MEFRRFDVNTFQETLKVWEQEAEAVNLFPGEQLAKLGSVQKALSASSVASAYKELAYGVFDNGSRTALAVCELVLTDRGALVGRWLKMLNVLLSPKTEAGIQEGEMQAITTAVHAYRCAVLGAFSERLTHEADTLKIYARNDPMLRFLMVFCAALTEDKSTNLQASKEGRWLVIRSVNK